MAEEPQVLSIQDRIRALKQAQAGQSPSSEATTGSPFPGTQPTAFALRPASAQSNGVSSTPPPPYSPYSPSGKSTPVPPAQRPAPPPIPQSAPPSEIAPGTRLPPKRPPPLPARKSSSQQLAAPSLPPRRPSVDSVASDASRSTTASTVRSNGSKPTTPGSVVKAPAWGTTELPPLPPKRQSTQPAVSPSRPKPTTLNSNGRSPPPRPGLPPRRSSAQSTSTVSTESNVAPSRSQSRPPPQLPRRDTDKSPSPPTNEGTNGQAQTRRLPPPTESAKSLNKIIGFSTKTSGTRANEPEKPNGVPPPVPMGSRPDLSAIQATKPKLPASNVTAAPVLASCLKCRDFSAVDAHAARYPRQSLPTQDLGWLARELTAPFISATDKARAIFTWLHHNIDYDTVSFYGNCVKPSSPSNTLATGLAVCDGYAGLFLELATHAGLEAKRVTGHGKGYGYGPPAPGASCPPRNVTGHAWNVVRIDNGQWKLIDCCWGAGHVQGPRMPYVRSFTPAMFTNSNDEFGLKHYPSDRAHFYRDDGRPEITWEEYIIGNPNSPLSAAQPRTFGDAAKHSIGERSYRPAATQISIREPGPMRFQFNLICEHWSLERQSRAKPGLFLLMIHGIDGRKDDRLPFIHWRGGGPGGGGDVWYVDVPDPRALGAPGQKVQLAVLTKIGDKEDARGVTVEEYQRQVGRVGMAWAYVAEWDIVA